MVSGVPRSRVCLPREIIFLDPIASGSERILMHALAPCVPGRSPGPPSTGHYRCSKYERINTKRSRKGRVSMYAPTGCVIPASWNKLVAKRLRGLLKFPLGSISLNIN